MIPLSSSSAIPRTTLTWWKIPRSRNYELKQNGEVVGTLRRPGWFETSFAAETKYGKWTFRRGGFLGGSAVIVDMVSKQPVATLKSSWRSGGTLTFTDGQRFELRCEGWWRPVWSVLGADGRPVLRLHAREKTVEVPSSANPAAVPGSRWLLLAMFTFYRVLQAEEDAAVAVLVAAS